VETTSVPVQQGLGGISSTLIIIVGLAVLVMFILTMGLIFNWFDFLRPKPKQITIQKTEPQQKTDGLSYAQLPDQPPLDDAGKDEPDESAKLDALPGEDKPAGELPPAPVTPPDSISHIEIPVAPLTTGIILVREDGVRMQVTALPAVIGRSSDCQVILADESVSNHHAEIFIDAETGEVNIRDLGSRNGLWVNDQPTSWNVLQDGDVIGCGSVRLTYQYALPNAADGKEAS